MSCCPAGSWPALDANYEGKGNIQDIGEGLQTYIVGEVSSKKSIILVPDVFGPGGGRNSAIADQLAAEGYFVLLPDIFRGNPLPNLETIGTWLPQFPYEKVKPEIQTCVRFLQSKDAADKVGLMGFCYGCWINFKLCGDSELQNYFSAGVNCHPSLIIEQKFFNRDPSTLVEPLTVPQLLLSAGNDPPFVQADGDIIKLLREKPFGDKCNCIDFPDQKHGWVNRGDVSDETVKNEVKRAIESAIAYFKENL